MSDYPRRPFRTDGCSLWPDGSYLSCCVKHDRVYWAGGSPYDRLRADERLRSCVYRTLFGERGWSHTTATLVSDLMYYAVRVFGHPVWPFPWRWNYGRRWTGGYSDD